MNKKKLKHVCIFIFFLFLVVSIQAEVKKYSLESAVQSALSLNERAATADEKVNAAQARILKARSVFFPTLSTTETFTRRPEEVTREMNNQTVVIQRLNGLGATLNMSMALLDPRSFPAYKQLLMAGKAEKLNASESKRSLAFEVCNAFLVTLGNEQILGAAQQRLELAQKNLDASKARYQAQLVSVNDVTRNELEVATAEKNVTSANGGLETAMLQLEFLVGAKIDSELENPLKLLSEAEAPPPSQEVLIPKAYEQRLDIKALEFQAKAQHYYSKEPMMRWFPNLYLNGQYKITNEAGFQNKNYTWSIGLTMNWTIFDGLSRIGDLKERKALARVADLDTHAAKRKLEVQVKNALVSLINQQASLKKAAVALDTARKNAEETSELYRQGLTGVLQSADANVKLYEAEVGYISERYGLAIAFLNLRMAQGLDPFGVPSSTETK